MRRMHCAIRRKPRGRVCRCPLGAEEHPQLFAGDKPETTRKQVILLMTGVSVEAGLPPEAPNEN